VLNARGRVSAHLDAPITVGRAGRRHFYGEVGSAFESTVRDDLRATGADKYDVGLDSRRALENDAERRDVDFAKAVIISKRSENGK
jgi:hypothetical protein